MRAASRLPSPTLGQKGEEAGAHPRLWRDGRGLCKFACVTLIAPAQLPTGGQAAYCDCQQGDKFCTHRCSLQGF